MSTNPSPSETTRRRGTGRLSFGPSMADVAALAGVSSQTVSRVANGEDNVREQTRARVLEAMDQLGYSPNLAARSLRNGRFDTLGLVAHELRSTGEAQVIGAVIEEAWEKGYTVQIVELQSPSASEGDAAVARLSHQAIDGLVVIRAENLASQALALSPKIPVVVSDSIFAGHLPSVATDQARGTRLAVQHLLDLGHKTVHHLAGPERSRPARQRESTWEAVLREAGRSVPAIVRGDWTCGSGYLAGQVIAADPEVTAVFCANDEMALGLFHALFEAGRRVPEDISVVGFDGIALAAHAWPPLTTVLQDFHQVGCALVDLVMRQIGGENLTDHRTLLPVELVVRESTARPSTQGAR